MALTLNIMVRIEVVETSSLPWEGSIIAVIRYPHTLLVYQIYANKSLPNFRIIARTPKTNTDHIASMS